jgi:C1A family cysteine protease
MLVNKKYLLRADPEDFRDLPYEPKRNPLKKIVDLREWCDTVEQQGHLGSCTGNAVVGAYEMLQNFEKSYKLTLSRLFVYYNSRLIEGNTERDEGAYIRDAVKALKKYGVCAEVYWPYRIERFAMTPDEESYQDAQRRNIKNYYRLSSLEDILDALNNNWPVVFGMLVYPEFETITNEAPVLKMSDTDEEPIGAHAMFLVGYDLDRELVLARNSFGSNWGDGGHCWIPFDYVRREFVDIWIFDIDLITPNLG